MEKTNNYLLKYHDFFYARIRKLKIIVETLKNQLSHDDYKQHETVKLLGRLMRAADALIPMNPNHQDYYLRGNLSKFRRFKKGIQRYRILFCFSTRPSVIAYLYVNDKNHLRMEGSKNDPYYEFSRLLNSGLFSHNPNDSNMKKWLRNQL